MPAYITLLPGAFNDDSVTGRTVQVEEIQIDDGVVTSFSFTWPENPYDLDTVAPEFCRPSTREEVERAERAYKEEAEELLPSEPGGIEF